MKILNPRPDLRNSHSPEDSGHGETSRAILSRAIGRALAVAGPRARARQSPRPKQRGIAARFAGPASSEDVLQRQLQLAFAGLGRHLSEGRAHRIVGGAAPVRMIEDIEDFPTELQTLLVGYREVLAQA